MKRLLGIAALLLLAGIIALGFTLTPEVLPQGGPLELRLPAPAPPPGMRVAVIKAGKMKSQAAFAYRGGALTEPRDFNMGSFVVQHPQGTLLFDAGFGRNVDAHFRTIPWLMRATTTYEKEVPAVEQLRQAGIALRSLAGVVLTHAHWDHVSGLEDFVNVPVWVTQDELAFVQSGHEATALARAIEGIDWQVYDFPHGPYLGFPRSMDVFGDGAVVLVPAPGHTPGSIIAFVHTPDGKHYALIGDLAWQTEGVDIPAQRPWLSRRLVDLDAERVRGWLVHLHRVKMAMPDLIVVPAHDRRVADRLPALAGVTAP